MKKTEKIRYEIDPHNRLIYEKTGEESEVPGFRTVLDGSFEIDENNYVTYHVKKSQAFDIPQQVKLRGKWALDNEHNLVLTLDKWGNQIAGNKLTVESELIDAKDNRLSFAVTSKDSENNTHIYIVKLGGRWQADEYNRLTFNIQKETGVTDRITLRGAWEVNQQNEIMYTYEKSARGKEEKITKKEVKALKTPPTESITRFSSIGLGHFCVPLNTICSKKWEMPLRFLVSSLLPTRTINKTVTDSVGMGTVKALRPFGKIS